MRTASETDLPDLLDYLGYSVRRVGQYYATREMDSIRIKDRRIWTRYSTKQRGDAITFLQEFCGKTFVEAVRFLLEYHGRARDSPAKHQSNSVQKESRPPFSLPPAWHDHRRVFAYLRGRGIASQVIEGFVGAGLLYEDALHHNCVFVGRNGSGEPVFANKRSTNTIGAAFKGDETGSDKSVAFRLPCDPEKQWVAVFEAPIDLMSFCTLHRDVRSNAVALCGLSKGALDTYLTENPHLKHIVFCLDADEPGRNATAELTEEYGKRGYRVSTRQPGHGKDWNEYLQQKKSVRERGR